MSPFPEKRFLPKRKVSPGERERLIGELEERLLEVPDILFAYLHGSFLAEDAFRDIDVAVFTGVEKGFSFESDLSFELTKTLGYEIDLRVINDAPVGFQMEFLRNGRLLLNRHDDARTEFVESVGRRYRQYAHLRNVFMEAVGAER